MTGTAGRGAEGDSDDRDTVVAINFVADAGKQMLESSTSVSEVIERLRGFVPTVGLDGCSVDANMSSLILSYWRPDDAFSITTMRDVDIAVPRLEVLSGTGALLDQVEAGSLSVEEAAGQLRDLEQATGRGAVYVRTALLVSVLGWVLFLDGFDLVTVLVALLATALTFPIENAVRRLRLPSLAATFLGAVVVAAIPNLLAAAGVSLQVGPAVVGALYIYLPGRALVSSVIDGLANAPLSSMSRGLQALVTAGFLALGMLVGSQIGTGLGLDYDPDVTATPLLLSVIGAALGVLGLAAAWSMPRNQLVPATVIGAAGWLIVAVATDGNDGSGWVVYALAAGVVGIAGAVVASMQGAPASAYTGVAILPLVPGFTLYTGMLAIAQGNTADAASALADAGVISLAIAVGVAVGLGLGRDGLTIAKRLIPTRG